MIKLRVSPGDWRPESGTIERWELRGGREVLTSYPIADPEILCCDCGRRLKRRRGILTGTPYMECKPCVRTLQG